MSFFFNHQWCQRSGSTIFRTFVWFHLGKINNFLRYQSYFLLSQSNELPNKWCNQAIKLTFIEFIFVIFTTFERSRVCSIGEDWWPRSKSARRWLLKGNYCSKSVQCNNNSMAAYTTGLYHPLCRLYRFHIQETVCIHAFLYQSSNEGSIVCRNNPTFASLEASCILKQ